MRRSKTRTGWRATPPPWLLACVCAGAVLALCYAADTLGRASDAPYARLLQSCRSAPAQPYLSCVNGSVLEYVSSHPQAAGAVLQYVSRHGRDGERAADLRWFSATAHYAGMELSVGPLPLASALRDCGDAFKAACMHGFVMERLDRKVGWGAGLVRAFRGYCQPVSHDSDEYENCLHAVGHEFWARTQLSLNRTLRLCDPLPSAADRTACWSGVLMEYSEGSDTRGRHSHAPAGKRQLRCGELPTSVRRVCADAEASYRQYIPGWEPPRTTYERCAAASRSADRLGCMALVSERLLLARGGERSLAASTCASLRFGRALCTRSISLVAR